MTAHLREAVVDLDAIAHNVGVLDERSGGAGVMAVVKADAYGHGLVPCARAALTGGAGWLGTALVSEALELRAAGIDAPVLAWLVGPGERWAEAIEADVDLSVNQVWALAEVVDAAQQVGRTARVQLKVDTGLGRGGSTVADWPDLVAAARKAEAAGAVDIVGVWSHLAYADRPGHATIDAQLRTFGEALKVADGAGLSPQVRHIANSAATLTRADARFDLTRPGLSVYGLSPFPTEASAADLGLHPAMTLTARLVMVKDVPAGQGVSYLHKYVTAEATSLGLVPLGYADGIPRNATNVGPVSVGGRRTTIAGTVCMDQFVLDLGHVVRAGDLRPAAGDTVVVFGPGSQGEPTADEWASATGTISYEIITRVGARVHRRYVGGGG